MNVSTKSEYGLRALIYLASHSESRLIPAPEIAEKWNVPVNYDQTTIADLCVPRSHQAVISIKSVCNL